MDERKGYELYRKVSKRAFPITLAIVAVAFVFLAVTFMQTGVFFERDISLAGGVTTTFATTERVDVAMIESDVFALIGEPVRVRSTAGARTEVVIEARIQDQEDIDTITTYVTDTFGIPYDELSITFIGETLGSSFFQELLKALAGAFMLMAGVSLAIFHRSLPLKLFAVSTSFILALSIVLYTNTATSLFTVLAISAIYLVFISRQSLPSAYIIFAAFADIVLTVTVVNLIGMPVSVGGLAAFLMILGYSIDTDILLTTKMLKRQKEPVESRFAESFVTGMTMTGTSFIAVVIGAIVTNSPMIREIMVIIAIGLFFDAIITWTVNGHLVMRKLDAEVRR